MTPEHQLIPPPGAVPADPVVFLILSHRDPALVERLVDRLGNTESAITAVHHDAKATAVPSLPANGRSTLIPDPVSVTWGTMGPVNATLRGLRWIREEIRDFSWVVTISGQDYPVMSPREIEAELLASSADAMLRWEFVPPFARRHCTDWQRGTSRRYYQHMLPRTHRMIPVPRLRAYFDGVGVHAGSTWLNLGRRAVDTILDDKPMLDYLSHRFGTTLAPLEAFFQTLLLNEPTGLDLVCRDRRFYRFPETGDPSHPDILTIEDLGVLRASDAFFARKMEPGVSDELLDELDRLALPTLQRNASA